MNEPMNENKAQVVIIVCTAEHRASRHHNWKIKQFWFSAPRSHHQWLRSTWPAACILQVPIQWTRGSSHTISPSLFTY